MTSPNNFSNTPQITSTEHPPAEQTLTIEECSKHQQSLWQRKTTRRAAVFGGLGTLATAGLGGSWAYNRYLAEHTEISDVAAYEAQQTSATASATASSTELTSIALTENGLTADQGSITLNIIVTGSGSDQITAYSAEIILDNQTLLRSAFANNQFGLNIIDVPSSIASEHNGIWAVNGDYYGFRETGIVVRNGVVYRDSPAREGLAFYKDGTVKVYDETTTSAHTLVDEGVWNTLSFGPSLLNSGEIINGIDSVEVDTNFGNHSIQGEQPRTAIGVKDKNHLIFLVVDGRSEGYSRGATMPELAQMLKDLGCVTGYNIDGGGSSVMVFNGPLVNNPLGKGEERGTSDILYIAGSVA